MRLPTYLYLALATVTILALNGCAAYTVTSGVTLMTTGKSIADHSASMLTGMTYDCDGIRTITTGTYYCEKNPDAGERYNRTAF